MGSCRVSLETASGYGIALLVVVVIAYIVYKYTRPPGVPSGEDIGIMFLLIFGWPLLILFPIVIASLYNVTCDDREIKDMLVATVGGVPGVLLISKWLFGI